MQRVEELIGQPSKEVIKFIVQNNPQIKNTLFMRYHPEDPDDLDAFWHYPGLEFSPTESLPDFLDYLTSPRLESLGSEIGIGSLVETKKEPDPNVYMDLTHYYSHIPMLDFAFSYTDQNEAIERMKHFLQEAGQAGWLLYSGDRSYHFYGRELMPTEAWERFLIAADAEGLASKRFIKASFDPKITKLDPSAGRYSTLRIASSARKPQVPYIIAAIS